jgi:hypothetical protein
LDDLGHEPIHNVAGLFKRYLRDMPTPVFDVRLRRLFDNACIESTAPLGLRILAARLIVRLLPKRQLSLFIYLLAFLAQVPLNRACHLDHVALGSLLGPALFAPRTPHIAGLGRTTLADNSQGLSALDGEGNAAIRSASNGLAWILEHWAAIGADFMTTSPSAEPGLPPLQPALAEPLQPVFHPVRAACRSPAIHP